MPSVARRVGVVLVGVADLAGGGGAERYFADLVSAAATRARGPRLDLLADRCTLSALAKVGRVLPPDAVVELPAGALAQQRCLLALARAGSYAVLHLVQGLPRHLGWLSALRLLGGATAARVSLNVNDTRIAYGVGAPWSERLVFSAYLALAPLDGVMSWYEVLTERLRARRRRPAVLHSARHCSVDAARFRPDTDKRNLMVFGGRLVAEKRPLLFLDGIAAAYRLAPSLMCSWRCVLFGAGPLAPAVAARIDEADLRGRVRHAPGSELAATLAASRVFVSTQDSENFTSLSMLEAMACGNAIVARDVGQTHWVVHAGENGLLVPAAATAEDVADALVTLATDSDRCAAMGAASRALVEREHNVECVLDEFGAFWDEVAAVEHASR